MNPFADWVNQWARLHQEGQSIPLGRLPPLPKPSLSPGAPRVLLFSPHPDDECIIGGLPFRLLREAGCRVINVAVTQGSRQDRQAARFQELQAACAFVGYDLVQIPPNGLEKVNFQTREKNAELWVGAVQKISDILASYRPSILFFPHEHDWNSTHIGTHWLVMDALASLGQDFACYLVETEYWGQMAAPNLMVESSPSDVGVLVAGTSFHVGEVRRNPFHLLLPAWMQDNVRRGSELVGGQGEAAPDYQFATLYRLRYWRHRQVEALFTGGKKLACGENPAALFPELARAGSEPGQTDASSIR